MKDDGEDRGSQTIESPGIKPILIIGLGNPILGDDGFGWHVVERVSIALTHKPLEHQVEIDSLALGGLSLMERLIGYERVIIIDAITTRQKPNGTLYGFNLEALPDLSSGHTTAAHDTSLKTALGVGRAMGLHLPSMDQIMIIGVEAEMVYNFSEELSPEIDAALSPATDAVLELLSIWEQDGDAEEWLLRNSGSADDRLASVTTSQP